MTTSGAQPLIDSLTLRDFAMLRDAVFQRSADARNAREEDRWLSLDSKLRRMESAAERKSCRCGHARKSHRSATPVVSTCLICQCQSFDHAPAAAPNGGSLGS